FKTIQETSRTLRVALAARDRGWAELPSLAQWLTLHPVSDDAKANVPVAKDDLDKKLKTLGAGIDSLIELTRLLDTLLEAPAVAAFQDEKEQKLKLKQLNDQAEIVTGSCKQLSEVGVKMQEKVSKKLEADQLNHHLIECLLSVPLLTG